MANVSKVDLYSIEIGNKTGEGAKALGALKEAGVNFAAVWGYPVGKRAARIDVIPTDGGAFKKAAKKAKLELGDKHTAFVVTGDDQPGAIADALAKIAGAGISVLACQGVSSGDGHYGAAICVGSDDVKKAFKALSA